MPFSKKWRQMPSAVCVRSFVPELKNSADCAVSSQSGDRLRLPSAAEMCTLAREFHPMSAPAKILSWDVAKQAGRLVFVGAGACAMKAFYLHCDAEELPAPLA